MVCVVAIDIETVSAAVAIVASYSNMPYAYSNMHIYQIGEFNLIANHWKSGVMWGYPNLRYVQLTATKLFLDPVLF